jgi:hypothetical protein
MTTPVAVEDAIAPAVEQIVAAYNTLSTENGSLTSQVAQLQQQLAVDATTISGDVATIAADVAEIAELESANSLTSKFIIPGEVIFGYYQGSDLESSQAAMWSQIGRPAKIMKEYMDYSNDNSGNPLKNAQVLAMLAAGVRVIHLQFGMCIYNNNPASTLATVAPQPGGTGTPSAAHPWFGYDDIQNGHLDPQYEMIGTGLLALTKQYPDVIFVIDTGSEPDDGPRLTWAKQDPRMFAPAYAYFAQYLKNMGLTNIEFSWTMSGWQYNQSGIATVGGAVTGETLYGWLSAGLSGICTFRTHDPYGDAAGQNPSKFAAFKTWIDDGGIGSDWVDKPHMLSEFGWGLGGGDRTAVFAAIPEVLKEAGIAVAQYWGSSTGAANSWHDFNVAGEPDEAGFLTMARALD